MRGLTAEWRRPSWRRFVLWWPARLYGLLASLRRALYRVGLLRSVQLPVPVVVVGNIHVGGSGKTPLTTWLARSLHERGWHPAIVSRGYGGSHRQPQAVHPDSDPALTGDEPVLLAQQLYDHEVPVWVGQDRVATAHALLAAHPEVNLILCDDGLQHYRLQRDVEICVIDGAAPWGSQALLPQGPLREPLRRLQRVDAIVYNGSPVAPAAATPPAFIMRLEPQDFYQVNHPEQRRQAADFQGERLVAVAGIGNPQRFARTLDSLGLALPLHAFPDHHPYQAADFVPLAADVILMTEKDAVKCKSLNNDTLWALCIAAEVHPDLAALVERRLNAHGR
ncbi:tetraacyldisaccharide 4'-kinase [Leeia sp.]|uniref:tetraacyldisaccharide 4'-kinase n=1 Tax=Leeia sp. TaxID=2884678 RepID=UPI0035B2CE48